MSPPTFTTLEQGLHTGYCPRLEQWPLQHPILLIFKQQVEFEIFWQQHKPSLPSAPPLDFDTHMVLVVLDNAESCGGYAIEIQAIESVDRFLRVSVLKSVPDSECIVTWSTTQPFHIVSVPHSLHEILLDLTTLILPLEAAL